MRQEWICLRLAGSGRPVARSRRARTLWERFRGLMLAPPLPPGEALWLPACGAVHTAFLRGAVDLLFLRGERIVRVSGAVAPWRVAACAGADSVIELAAGEAARLGLAPGQQLEVAAPAGGAERTA
jgi:uncharacterized membrane protein (UPF0127 family)